MNRHSSAILAVVITFFVTLALNTGLNVVSSYNGSIRIGAPVRVGSERMFPITIENYSAKFLDGLALLFPAGITPSDLVADGPVTVTSGAQSGDSQIIRVGQISPRKVTTINIRLPEGRHFEMVQILNPSELGVSLRETTGVESPLRKILIAAASSALIYTAIAIFFAHLLKIEIAHMKVETAALKKDLKGRVKDTKKVSKEIEQLRSTVAKQRLLLLARLRDYAKELEFWRNAVRTLILRKGGDLEAADALIERITQQLGTLGTKGSAETYETIRVVAAWTAEAESGQQPKKSSKRPGGDGA